MNKHTIKAKLLHKYIRSEEELSEIYDEVIKEELREIELAYAQATINPIDKDLESVKEALKKTNKKNFTHEELVEAHESVINVASIANSMMIKEKMEANRQKVIETMIDSAKKKEKRILSVKPFENILCPACSSEMRYKWSDLYEEDGSESSVLLFYECPKCSKREGVFEDGRRWTSKATNNCPLCHGKRQTTLTKDKDGHMFLIHGCLKCNTREVETA